MILGGKKLKIELVEVFETMLAYRVLEQDESLRGQGVIYGDKFCIQSVNLPEIAASIHRLCIRGLDTNSDDIEITYKFTSSKERATFIANCKAALEEINKPEPLTFERIRKECIPMKHWIIANDGTKFLYLGFTRNGKLITDRTNGMSAIAWEEYHIKDWTIEVYDQSNDV